MKVIKDLRTIKAISKRYDFDYKYIIKSAFKYTVASFKYKNKDYKIKYLNGAIFPYIVEV
jgi:hypothetical protein